MTGKYQYIFTFTLIHFWYCSLSILIHRKKGFYLNSKLHQEKIIWILVWQNTFGKKYQSPPFHIHLLLRYFLHVGLPLVLLKSLHCFNTDCLQEDTPGLSSGIGLTLAVDAILEATTGYRVLTASLFSPRPTDGFTLIVLIIKVEMHHLEFHMH